MTSGRLPCTTLTTVSRWRRRVTPSILEHRRDELAALLGEDAEALAEYDSILTAIRHLPPRSETDPARVAERQREKEVIKRRLAALTEAHPAVQASALRTTVALFNGTPGDPHSFDLLDTLLQQQAYRLCHWRVASEEINYRRFFDINDLAALSMEKPEVFAATHGLILRLLSEGKVHGVRIDHPDGLYDPQQYLERLQQHYVLGVAQRLLTTDPACQALGEQEIETLLQAATGPDGAAATAERCAGHSISWWKKFSGRGKPCGRTGRSTAPVAMTF